MTSSMDVAWGWFRREIVEDTETRIRQQWRNGADMPMRPVAEFDVVMVGQPARLSARQSAQRQCRSPSALDRGRWRRQRFWIKVPVRQAPGPLPAASLLLHYPSREEYGGIEYGGLPGNVAMSIRLISPSRITVLPVPECVPLNVTRSGLVVFSADAGGTTRRRCTGRPGRRSAADWQRFARRLAHCGETARSHRR